jgi:orotate phosphoribosyltransferase
MTSFDDPADKVAEFLLQIKAVKLQPDKPFTWASGLRSPIYCDNRKTLSYPKIRTYIRQHFVEVINEHFVKPDLIAGVATGAVAIGALVAQEMGLPFVYVRAEAKKHGLTNQIEGEFEKGQSVVVIEDLISTGGSSLKAVEALREKGCVVKGLVAIFTYGFDESVQAFKKAKCRVETLTDYNTLLKTAVAKEYITDKEAKSLKEWRANPGEWEASRATAKAK